VRFKATCHAVLVASYERDVVDPISPAHSIVDIMMKYCGTSETTFLATVDSQQHLGKPWKKCERAGFWQYDDESADLARQIAIANNISSGHFSRLRIGNKIDDSNHDGLARLWSVSFVDASITSFDKWEAQAEVVLPLHGVAISDRHVRESRKTVDAIVTELFGSQPPVYLFVDAREWTGNSAAIYYDGTLTCSHSPLDRLIEKQRWHAPDRKAPLRGVFWGNYLNRSCLDRLGGKEAFKNDYLQHARNVVRGWRQLVREVGDGLFVTISESPIDECASLAGMHYGLDNAVWLDAKLRAAGLLL